MIIIYLLARKMDEESCFAEKQIFEVLFPNFLDFLSYPGIFYRQNWKTGVFVGKTERTGFFLYVFYTFFYNYFSQTVFQKILFYKRVCCIPVRTFM